MFKKKKGIIRDVGYILIIFFVFLTSIIFANYIWYEVNDNGFQTLDFVDAPTKQRIDDMSYGLLFLDKIAPFFFVGLWLLTLFASITVQPDHPIFLILNIGILLFFTLLSILLVDLGNMILSESIFNVILNDIGNTRFFIGNYHLIGFGIMIISLIIFFRRTRMSQGVGLQ